MEIIEWIEFIDKCLKNQPLVKDHNPYPYIFCSYVDYMFFIDDWLDVIPIVKIMHKKIIEKYPEMGRDILEAYILVSYFLCLKFYSDSFLTFPLRSVRYILNRKYTVNYISLIEIDILETMDYTFPINF